VKSLTSKALVQFILIQFCYIYSGTDNLFLMKQTIFLLLLFFLSSCSKHNEEAKIEIAADEAYPRWIIKDSLHTTQTSGIAFIGEKEQIKYFLLADDNGVLHRFSIESDTLFELKKIAFNENVKTYLDTFPKPDFEEISFDKKNNKVFLSIEGTSYGKINPARKETNVKYYAGIYELRFKDDDLFSDTIVSIQKLHFEPEEKFFEHVKSNIAFEGFTFDDDYFYAGLEGFQEQKIFADSTFIYIINRATKKIVKQINTKKLGIFTICGLFSPGNKTLLGIDRNNKKLFKINFTDQMDVSSFAFKEIKTRVPNYPAIGYVASLESITMDNDNNIYMIDDPWTTYFVPAPDILNKMDKKTAEHFNKFIPIIYKFKLN